MITMERIIEKKERRGRREKGGRQRESRVERERETSTQIMHVVM